MYFFLWPWPEMILVSMDFRAVKHTRKQLVLLSRLRGAMDVGEVESQMLINLFWRTVVYCVITKEDPASDQLLPFCLVWTGSLSKVNVWRSLRTLLAVPVIRSATGSLDCSFSGVEREYPAQLPGFCTKFKVLALMLCGYLPITLLSSGSIFKMSFFFFFFTKVWGFLFLC